MKISLIAEAHNGAAAIGDKLRSAGEQTNEEIEQLEAFRDLTGVPIVLSTLFNEKEALDCFLRTRMDVLVMGRYYIERMQGE
jgi:carbamoyltransferase